MHPLCDVTGRVQASEPRVTVRVLLGWRPGADMDGKVSRHRGQPGVISIWKARRKSSEEIAHFVLLLIVSPIDPVHFYCCCLVRFYPPASRRRLTRAVAFWGGIWSRLRQWICGESREGRKRRRWLVCLLRRDNWRTGARCGGRWAYGWRAWKSRNFRYGLFPEPRLLEQSASKASKTKDETKPRRKSNRKRLIRS